MYITPPKILITSIEEFTFLLRSSRKRVTYFSFLRYFISLLIGGASTVITLSEYFVLPTNAIKILGAVIVLGNSLVALTRFDQKLNQDKLLTMTLKTYIKSIKRKIELWKDFYFPLPNDHEPPAPPDELSREKLFDFVNGLYDEIDKLKITDETTDSYNRVISSM